MNDVGTIAPLALANDWGTKPVPSISTTNPVESKLINEAEDTFGIGLITLSVVDELILGIRAIAQEIDTVVAVFGAI